MLRAASLLALTLLALGGCAATSAHQDEDEATSQTDAITSHAMPTKLVEVAGYAGLLRLSATHVYYVDGDLHAIRRVPKLGGAVENGSDTQVIHWASFFIVNGPAMPPLVDGPSRKVAGQATVSYKAHVVPREAPERGCMEWMLNESLRRLGHQLVTDSRIRVSHDQPLTFGEACAIHFHDSKTIAGFRLFEMTPEERALRTAACAVMAPLLFLRTTAPLVAKGRHAAWLVKSLPMIAVLCVCRAAGALAGFLLGHGTSPRQIR